MKAAVVCANEDVQYQDHEEPQAGPGEVKVRVKASGICGSDIPRVLHNGVHFYPIVLGHEFSGDVVEVGEGVTKVKVGDRTATSHSASITASSDPGSRAAMQTLLSYRNRMRLYSIQVSPMSRGQCLSLPQLHCTAFFRMIIRADSMWQSWVGERSECSRCSGQRSSVLKK